MLSRKLNCYELCLVEVIAITNHCVKEYFDMLKNKSIFTNSCNTAVKPGSLLKGQVQALVVERVDNAIHRIKHYANDLVLRTVHARRFYFHFLHQNVNI